MFFSNIHFVTILRTNIDFYRVSHKMWEFEHEIYLVFSLISWYLNLLVPYTSGVLFVICAIIAQNGTTKIVLVWQKWVSSVSVLWLAEEIKINDSKTCTIDNPKQWVYSVVRSSLTKIFTGSQTKHYLLWTV